MDPTIIGNDVRQEPYHGDPTPGKQHYVDGADDVISLRTAANPSIKPKPGLDLCWPAAEITEGMKYPGNRSRRTR